MNFEPGRPSAPSFAHDTAWGFEAFCKYLDHHPDYELKKGDLVLFVVSSITGKLTSLPLGIYEAELGVSLEQWFSNCGTRTTSGTRGLFRWYASSFPVIIEKLC